MPDWQSNMTRSCSPSQTEKNQTESDSDPGSSLHAYVTHSTVWNLWNFIADSQQAGCQAYITWNYLPTHQLSLDWEKMRTK